MKNNFEKKILEQQELLKKLYLREIQKNGGINLWEKIFSNKAKE